MKKVLQLFLITCCIHSAYSQSADSLLHLLKNATGDTEKIDVLDRLIQEYYLDNPDTAMLLVQEGLAQVAKNDYPRGEARLLSDLGDVYRAAGNYTKALEAQLKSLDFENAHAPQEAANTLHGIALLYEDQQEMKMALSFYLKENEALKTYPDQNGLVWNQVDIAKIYALLGMNDSSKVYSAKALLLAKNYYGDHFPGYFLNTLGELYYYLGEDKQSFACYRESIHDLIEHQSYLEISESYMGLARLFNNIRLPDSSVYYAKQSLQISRQRGLLLGQLSASSFLSALYKDQHNIDSAFLYQELNGKIQDSLFSGKKVKEFQNIRFSKQLQDREIESSQATYRNRIKVYVLAGVLCSFLLFAIILYRSNRNKQKANFLLSKQKLEIDRQKTEVEKAYKELQSAQLQLVHAEKMASLGELTAGIAHEIQNPLNFVNNFSEVNDELIEELKNKKSTLKNEEQDELLNDILQNNEKIKQHGRRADSIVKGMLQHTRSGTGQLELTNINALADEYLRLSYHGLRAKDKSFNATMNTNFDENIGKINIIPQDIGRVLLNLYNNAFYSTNEKIKNKKEKYEPTVTVTTKKIGDQAEVRISDNGIGIPQNIIDKIFQPFFTTKPTGQGTGLGLSLAYDIVKAHGGELKVESKEYEGSTFIIRLPQ